MGHLSGGGGGVPAGDEVISMSWTWNQHFSCEQSINYVGPFFKKFNGVSLNQCGRQCKNSQKCHVFVWNHKNECYLKKRVNKADHNKQGTMSCKDDTVTYKY